MGRTGPVPNRPAGRRRARAARSETAVGGYKRPALGLTSGGTSLKRHHEECRQAQTAMLKPNGTRARRLDPSRTGRGMPSVSTVFEVRPRGRVSEAEAAETLAGRHYVVAGLVAQAAPMRLWRLRRSTHYPGPRPTPADLAYQDPGSPA